MYGMNTRGLPGTLAPIYQELQVERSEPPATSRTWATQLSSASARASMRLRPLSRRYPMQSATHSTCCSIESGLAKSPCRGFATRNLAGVGDHRRRRLFWNSDSDTVTKRKGRCRLQVRTRLFAGGSRIRTLGPPG